MSPTKRSTLRIRKPTGKTPLFTDEERAKMTVLLSAGFTDTFRHFYPDTEGIYSWWSYRFHAREKNAGWRIDYFITSSALDDRLVDAGILTDVTGPITVRYTYRRSAILSIALFLPIDMTVKHVPHGLKFIRQKAASG